MAEDFRVAVEYHGTLGYIAYDAAAKAVAVHLKDAEGRERAEKFLSEPHSIRVPRESLLDFAEEQIHPLADVRSLQTVLTRLWEATDVRVDWSRPVDYVIAHPDLSTTEKAMPAEAHA